MPNTPGILIPDHPSKVEKVKLKISSELHSKGRGALKDGNGFAPSDQELLFADIVTASLVPASYDIPYPTPQNQGGEGACAAFSSTYIKSIEYYFATGASSYSTSVNVFSPEYTYDYTKFSGCSGGTAITTCLDLFVNKGCCLWATLPYSDSNGCDVSTASPNDAEAATYKIGGYSKLLRTDRAGIKAMIANNHPVVCTLSIDSAYQNAGAGFIWSYATATGIGNIGHSNVIVGYDDSLNAYKILNQWGSSWGDTGTTHIDYDFFETSAVVGFYVYLISTSTPPSNTAPIANAGPDQTATTGGTVNLDGSASSDPDGYIASYLWAQVGSTPAVATIANTTGAATQVSGLTVAGTYTFRLTVTDNSSATATDDVNVIVTGGGGGTETYNITVTKTSVKGKTSDNISWSIALNTTPQSASLEYGTSSGGPFTTLYNIVPYSPQGTFSYQPNNKKITRYYRLKVVKSDGTVVYSTVKSIR